jgi:hypothetical protein
MLLPVHTYSFWRGSGYKVINTDHIKKLEAITIGRFAAKTNAKITFIDGDVLKVTNSVEDLRSYHNCGRPAIKD